MLGNKAAQRRAVVASHLGINDPKYYRNKSKGEPTEEDKARASHLETVSAAARSGGSTESITVVDNRDGKAYEFPLEHTSFVNANHFKKLSPSKGPSGVMMFDPGYNNTAVCRSKITYIDGAAGVLRYRGYPIEQLAEKSSFLEVAYLLIHGDLPNKAQFEVWNRKVMTHTFVHQNLNQLMGSFRYDAHPMGMCVSAIAALNTFYPEANPALQGAGLYSKTNPLRARMRNKQIFRLLGKAPTIAANAYRHRIGRPYNSPRSDLSYTENLLFMMDCLEERDYRPHPDLARALDVLFILHADHELNASTAAMRHLASTGVDPYTAFAGASGALYGPKHGGANEGVLRMLQEIGTKENIPAFLDKVKRREALLMGFGHRVYKNYDPRARIIRPLAYKVFEVVGKEPLVDVAVALEQAALADEFFTSRNLYPNVDFYSGIIYKAMGIPTDFFPVMFLLGRSAGWLAHWLESLDDPDTKIIRPRQVYQGEQSRDYVPMEARPQDADLKQHDSYKTPYNKRRDVSNRK